MVDGKGIAPEEFVREGESTKSNEVWYVESNKREYARSGPEFGEVA